MNDELLNPADAGGAPTRDRSNPPRLAPEHGNERPGTRIGPYKLLQLMGEGGMGAVWMAEQTEPVQRRVALKIIKAGLDSKQILARFEAERQALAMMDHPNIAKVFDAGATAEGRPFVVMELVKGIPFTKYCDQEKLTPAQRLELFIPICNAVQHAHQKGIIHRDLKPTNVLIALYDGKPVPKVIDFGIAKATHQKLTERTMFTEVGQLIGTLEYMAPEQAELNNLDIDTRADIYSLGVMLYEMLTGEPPFTAKQLRGESFIEMMRLIREVEPSKPSTKLSSSHELPAIAAKRKLEPKKLTGMMQGDLDWIVMKCLEKDRSRRYETANQLGQELQRFLADEPVQAGPPSAGYRMKKFLRRNKGPVVAAALVFVALITGITSTSIALVSASQARDSEVRQRKVAEANEVKAKVAAEEAQKANQTAQGRLQQIEKSNLLLESMFNLKSPLAGILMGGGMGASGGMPGMMGMGGMQMMGMGGMQMMGMGGMAQFGMMGMGGMGGGMQFAGMSGLAMGMYGMQFVGVGAPPPPVPVQGIMMGISGGSPGMVGMVGMAGMPGMMGLGGGMPGMMGGGMYGMMGMGGGMMGAVGFQGMLGMNGMQFGGMPAGMGGAIGGGIVDPIDQEPLTRKWSNQLYLFAGSLDEDVSNNPETVVRVWNTVGVAMASLGESQRAVELLKKAHARRAKLLTENHADTLKTMDNLAYAYFIDNQLAEAETLYERILKIRKEMLPAEHPDTLKSMDDLATIYSYSQEQKQRDKILPLLELNLEARKRKPGPDHPDTLAYMQALTGVYQMLGKFKESEKLGEIWIHGLKTALRKKQAAGLGPDDPATLQLMNDVASAYESSGQWAQSRAIWEEIKAAADAKHPGDEYHPDRLSATKILANAYQRSGKQEDFLRAFPLLEGLLAKQKEIFGAGPANAPYQMMGIPFVPFGVGRVMMGGVAGVITVTHMFGFPGANHELLSADTKPFVTSVHSATYQGQDTQASLNDLAHRYFHAKQPDKALALIHEFLANRRKAFNPDVKTMSPVQLTPQGKLDTDLASAARDLLRHGQYAAAEPFLRECHDIRLKAEPDVWTTFETKTLLGDCLRGQKKYAQAEPLLLQGYEGVKKHEKKTGSPGSPNPIPGASNLVEPLQRLVRFYDDQGKTKESARWSLELSALMAKIEEARVNAEKENKKQLEVQTQALKVQQNYAEGLKFLEAKKPAQALPLLHEYFKHFRDAPGQDKLSFAEMLDSTAFTLLSHQQHAEAEPMLREALAIRVELQPHQWQPFKTKCLLGDCLVRAKKYKDAEPLLLESYQGMRRREQLMQQHEWLFQMRALNTLVQLYEEWGKKAEVERWSKERDTRKTYFKSIGLSAAIGG